MALLVYVTTSDKNEARKIASAVVEAKLAACANILPGMTSVYRWNDKIEHGQEAVLLFKTTEECFDRLSARIQELHSYDVPCIVALPIARGHQPFLDWISASCA